MFLVAVQKLANLASNNDLAEGAIYPSLHSIRFVSLEIAISVTEKAYEQNIIRLPKPNDIRHLIGEYMYDPRY